MSTRIEPMPALLDRLQERAALDGLLEDLRSGRGRALVMRGEAGPGGTPAAASSAGLRRGRHSRRGAPAMGLPRGGRRADGVGRAVLARDRGPPASVLP